MTRLWLAAASALVLMSCSQPYHRVEGAAWGTVYHITYQSDKNLDDSIVSVIAGVDASLSMFNDSSTVSRVNRGVKGVTDSLLSTVFRASVAINLASHGGFDPTVGPLVNLYGFGKGKRMTDSLPSRRQVDSVMKVVGLQKCSMDDRGEITIPEGAVLDFSSIAKGFGCDLIAAMLRRNGCENYMVEIGGEIAMRGRNENGGYWRVMIDVPRDENGEVNHECMRVITPGESYPNGQCGVATSGNYRNYYLTGNGERVNHILDPRSGEPARSPILSATVIAPTCMEADGLATACMTMSPGQATKMIEQFPNASGIIVR